MTSPLYELREAYLARYNQQIPQHLHLLVEDICAPHQDHVVAVLFYGSCLHHQNPLDGLADLYVIVSSYRNFWGRRRLLSLAGSCLPPNVFYRELESAEGTVRCKYAVLSMADFEAGCKTWFHTYVYGRFAQPIALVKVRSEADKACIIGASAVAAERLLNESIPLMTAPFDTLDIWREALVRSYGAEIRTERSNHIDKIISQSLDYFQDTARAYLEAAAPEVQPATNGRWHNQSPHAIQFRLRWARRTFWGKWLSFMRLAKGFFTFDGGVDYIIYKLEKHTGETIQVPDRVRKWPLIFLWGLLFRLWRRGLFR